MAIEHPVQSDSLPNSPLQLPLWQSWTLLAIVTLVLGAPSLIFPFGRDQLYYAFIGDAFLHGKVLYRDIPMMQMPLAGLVHSLAMILFGHSMTAIRILDLFWTFAIVGFIFLLVRRVSGRDWLALLAALFYAVIYYSHNFWNSAQVDGFLNLPVTAGLYFACRAIVPLQDVATPSSRPGNARAQLVLAGFLLGTALFFKYTILLIIPGLFLIVLLAYRTNYRQGLQTILWLSLGVFLPIALFLIALSVTGGLGDFFAYQWQVTRPYSNQGFNQKSFFERIHLLFARYWKNSQLPLMLLFDVAGFLVAAKLFFRSSRIRSGHRLGLGLLFLWFAAALFSTFIQGKFFPYHYLSIIPPLAIFCAIAVGSLFRPLSQYLPRNGSRLILLGAGLICLTTLTVHGRHEKELFHIGMRHGNLEKYWTSDKFRNPAFSLKDQMQVSQYIEEHTENSDRVAFFSFDVLLFPHWRDPAMRVSSTVVMDPKVGKLHPEFESNPPELIVISHEDRCPTVRGHNRDSYEEYMAFPPIRNFLASHYSLETKIGNYDLLRRIRSEAANPASEAVFR